MRPPKTDQLHIGLAGPDQSQVRLPVMDQSQVADDRRYLTVHTTLLSRANCCLRPRPLQGRCGGCVTRTLTSVPHTEGAVDDGRTVVSWQAFPEAVWVTKTSLGARADPVVFVNAMVDYEVRVF
jgi:hypothetical protein